MRITAITVSLLIALPALARAQGSAETNPVVAEDAPDPGVLRVGPTYYMVTTSGDDADAFPIRTSTDLAHWTERGSIFPAGHWPTWATGNFWAPEIHQVGKDFVCYFAATDAADGHLCVGAAYASSPLGPYTDIGHPLVDDPRGGSIDPTEFKDTDGQQYLYWKFDGNAIGEPCQIYVLPLAADGLSVVGDPTQAPSVLTNDLPWEGNVVEAPQVTKTDGEYYLFYGGNYYGDGSYGLGVARSTSPTSGFTKAPTQLLQSGQGPFWGPGHTAVVADPDGNDYLVFAAHTGTPTGPREPCVARIDWVNGWPTVGDGTPPATFPAPAPDPGLPPPPWWRRHDVPATTTVRHFWDEVREARRPPEANPLTETRGLVQVLVALDLP